MNSKNVEGKRCIINKFGKLCFNDFERGSLLRIYGNKFF